MFVSGTKDVRIYLAFKAIIDDLKDFLRNSDELSSSFVSHIVDCRKITDSYVYCSTSHRCSATSQGRVFTKSGQFVCVEDCIRIFGTAAELYTRVPGGIPGKMFGGIPGENFGKTTWRSFQGAPEKKSRIQELQKKKFRRELLKISRGTSGGIPGRILEELLQIFFERFLKLFLKNSWRNSSIAPE